MTDTTPDAGRERVADEAEFWCRLMGEAVDALDECAADDEEGWDRQQHAADAAERIRSKYRHRDLSKTLALSPDPVAPLSQAAKDVVVERRLEPDVLPGLRLAEAEADRQHRYLLSSSDESGLTPTMVAYKNRARGAAYVLDAIRAEIARLEGAYAHDQ